VDVLGVEVAIRRLSLAFPHVSRREIADMLAESDAIVTSLTGKQLPQKAEEVTWLRLEAAYGLTIAA
jgi:hypothetical protein